MLLVHKQNSLAIVFVLYLQVFTSPFQKYHLRCTDCQTIQPKVRDRDEGPQISKLAANSRLPSALSSARDHQKLQQQTEPEVRRTAQTMNETIVVTDTIELETQKTTRRPVRGSRQRVTGTSTTASVTRQTTTTTSGTIVVGDPADSSPSLSSSNYSNKITYCDRLARRSRIEKGGDRADGQMFCVDYVNCPSIERETSSSRIRQLTCGLKLDGTIRVCCRDFDRSSLTEEEMTGGRVIGPDETFNSDGSADAEEEEELGFRPQRAPHKDNLAGRNRAPGTTSQNNNSSNEATVIVDDEQRLSTTNKSTERPPPPSSLERGPEQTGPELNQFASSTVKRPSQQVPEKFPRDCGFAQAGYNYRDELRIIGGQSARRNAWPWFALLMVQRRRRFEPECGATLITNRHVLTAAHCVLLQGGKRVIPKHQLKVRLGEFNLREQGDGELDFHVENIIAHREFNPRTFRNDIAIVKLSQNVSQFNESIWPACLAGLDGQFPQLSSQKPDSVDNHTVWVLGFGQTSYNGRTSDLLRQADLRIVPLNKCKRAFAHLVKLNRDYVCASSQYDDSTDASALDSAKPVGRLKDSCQGDSGGPLMMTMGDAGDGLEENNRKQVEDGGVEQVAPKQAGQATSDGELAPQSMTPSERWYIYGIVSFGFKCAIPNFAGVYCRVNRYLEWIVANTDY